MTVHRAHEQATMPPRGHVLRASVVLGFGLGALLDVLLLHDLLGWHHTLSNVAASARANEVADGVALALGWLATLAGIGLLWDAWHTWNEPRPTARLVGGLLVGLAVFDLADGMLAHLVLRLHHVRTDPPGGPLAWDLGFLLLSSALLALGVATARSPTRTERSQGSRLPHTRRRRRGRRA